VNADQAAAITVTQALQAIGVSAGILLAFAFLEGWPQAAWHTIRGMFTGPLISPADLEALTGAGPGDPQETRERLWCGCPQCLDEQAWEQELQ